MSVDRAITVRLEETDYERLEAEASRLGMRTGTLARVYVKAALAQDEDEKRAQLTKGLDALERLAVLQTGRPIDAVKLVQAGREDLDRRSIL